MPLYIEFTKPPSRKEYDLWVKYVGYIGSFHDYMQRESGRPIGGKIFINGDLGPHCASCAGFGDYLCDYPVGDDKTCDRPMCEDHSNEIGCDLHYCNSHYPMWKEFRDAGGVDESLKNVIAIKCEK